MNANRNPIAIGSNHPHRRFIIFDRDVKILLKCSFSAIFATNVSETKKMKQRQDKKAFSELIQKNQRIIHKITLIYANSAVDREDLFQEICLQLWLSYPNFREEAKFSTWMYRVALNTAISNIRKSKNSFSFEPLRETDRIPDESSDEKEHVKLLYSAISKLNRIDKAIILLWLEDKNYEEIATIMGTTKTNVSVKLVRIKRKLEELVSNTVNQES
jgi:RNA polymerase sigma-70 factor (ECF subfamily)